MTMTNKPVPQTPAGELDSKAVEKERKNQVKHQNPEGPADVANAGDRALEDGSSKEGAREVPSDKDRGAGVGVNEAR